MLWLDQKYINLLSPQLDRFEWKSRTEGHFRCPFCGDSERIKSKKRGYLYPLKQDYMFKCHNCFLALPFAALLHRLNRTLHEQWRMERMQSTAPSYRPDPPTPQKPPEPSVSVVGTPEDFVCLADIRTPQNPCYPVLAYIQQRQLPVVALTRLFATKSARKTLEPLVGKNKAASIDNHVPYLVIPLRLPSGQWYGCQLRPIVPTDNRSKYHTFRWSHAPLKIFGLENVDPSKPVAVVEGPIDSLFLPNALAACTSDLRSTVQLAQDLNHLSKSASLLFIWDAENRNAEITRQVWRAIKNGCRVVIWPEGIPKDINDQILAGLNPLTIISQHIFSGLSAELEFFKWSKVPVK